MSASTIEEDVAQMSLPSDRVIVGIDIGMTGTGTYAQAEYAQNLSMCIMRSLCCDVHDAID